MWKKVYIYTRYNIYLIIVESFTSNGSCTTKSNVHACYGSDSPTGTVSKFRKLSIDRGSAFDDVGGDLSHRSTP